MYPHEIVHQEILVPMSKQFPSMREIVVMTTDGLGIAGWDAEGRGPTIEYNPLEMMGIANLSISERLIEALEGGTPRCGIVAGKDATHLIHMIGSKGVYFLSIYITGNPPLDPIIDYIAKHDYLSEIERIFKS